MPTVVLKVHKLTSSVILSCVSFHIVVIAIPQAYQLRLLLVTHHNDLADLAALVYICSLRLRTAGCAVVVIVQGQ